MIVSCVKNCSDEPVLLLPLQIDQPLNDDNFVVLMGYTVVYQLTEYCITPGVEYTVFGVLAHKNQIRYLIQDDDCRPVFCPGEYFTVQDPNVHWDWNVYSATVDGVPLLVIGYPAAEGQDTYGELINLASRKDGAIKNFLKHKEWLNKYDISLR